MNLKALLDRMYPRSAMNEQGTFADDRGVRLERLNSQMHAAWDDLVGSPVRLRSMEGWIYPPNTTTENRVRLIVQHLVDELTDDRDYHSVDVSSSKLESDQEGAFISVLILNVGRLAPFRIPSTALLYVNPPAPGSDIRVDQ